MRWVSDQVQAAINRYLYTGAELQGTGGLGLLDLNARMYDPLTGRMSGHDILSELFEDISPYAYSYNNPVKFNDPTGMAPQNINGDIILDPVEVTIDPVIGKQVADPAETFWDFLKCFLDHTYKDERGRTYFHDKQGVVTSGPIIMGIAPSAGIKNGTKIFIKGVGAINKELFHRTIKGDILAAARKLKDFTKIVGDNPDIMVNKGKIVLQGAKNSPYVGKVYETGLNAFKFFK